MTPHRVSDLQKAYSRGHTAALRDGCVPGREQAPSVEKSLNRLLAISGGMFAFAVGAVTAVGAWLF